MIVSDVGGCSAYAGAADVIVILSVACDAERVEQTAHTAKRYVHLSRFLYMFIITSTKICSIAGKLIIQLLYVYVHICFHEKPHNASVCRAHKMIAGV